MIWMWMRWQWLGTASAAVALVRQTVCHLIFPKTRSRTLTFSLTDMPNERKDAASPARIIINQPLITFVVKLGRDWLTDKHTLPHTHPADTYPKVGSPDWGPDVNLLGWSVSKTSKSPFMTKLRPGHMFVYSPFLCFVCCKNEQSGGFMGLMCTVSPLAHTKFGNAATLNRVVWRFGHIFCAAEHHHLEKKN